MPELPEVEVVRRGLEPQLHGRRVQRVIVSGLRLRYPLPDALDAALCGLTCTALERRGKYLQLFFDGGEMLAWHLGMSGQFHMLPPQSPRARHEHVRIDFTQNISLRYRDARRFGYLGLLPIDGWQRHPWFRHLGPEPLSDAFDGGYLQQRCRHRKAPIKQVLMDAQVVAGIGNIYAAEALFAAGIHPARAAGRIGETRLHALAESIRQVLRDAIAAGGSTINDFVQVDGRPGYFSHAFQVYGRAGEACFRCGQTLRRLRQAGRSSFYCPGCQH